ncbi:cell division protein FtsL [Albidovulum sp.]|uniref:cell division protein FtsL n=1 Tax=Albidovulum sp. TaxID=1872424 RepID=UPI0039B8CD3F
MRSLILVLSAFAVVGLGFWAYRENYRTQGELAEVRRLQAEIGEMREALSVLNAEWAYLNRPDRLRELADINFERLGLLPFGPRQFGTVASVSYPAVALPPITEPVDTIALNGAPSGTNP